VDGRDGELRVLEGQVLGEADESDFALAVASEVALFFSGKMIELVQHSEGEGGGSKQERKGGGGINTHF